MIRHSRFEEECAVLRQSVLRSVEERDEFGLEQGLEVYERLVMRFIGKLGRLGVSYDREAARREVSGSIDGGWPQLEWIRDDYVTILRAANRSAEFSMIRRTLYFPFGIAKMALDAHDYLSFYYFLELPAFAYKLAEEVSAPALRTQIVDRLARYPHEFADYQLSRRLGEAESEGDIRWVQEMSEGLVGIYSGLLKAAVDASDGAAFRDMLLHLNLLFRNYKDSIPGFEEWLEYPNGDLWPQLGPESLYRQLKASLSILEDLRNVAKFGIAAWAVRCVQVEQSSERIENVLPALGFGRNLEKLTRTWINASEERFEELLRWSWWGLEGKQDGVIHWGGFEQYLNLAYVVLALRAIDGNDLPHAIEAFATVDTFPLEDSGSVQATLTDIGRHSELWGNLVGEDVFERVVALRQVFRATVERRRRVREEQVVNATLSVARVDMFAAAEEQGYKVLPDFLRLVQSMGATRTVPTSSLVGKQWGFNQLLPKEWFIEDTHVDISHVGKQLGQDLRAGLSGHVLKELLSGLPTEALREEPSLGEQIDPHLGVFRKRGGTPVILVVGTFRLINRLWNDPAFVHKRPFWGQRVDTSIGALEGVDVHHLLARDMDGIAVCDLARVGTWEQGVPDGASHGGRILAHEVQFTLRLLEEEELVRLASEREARAPKDDPVENGEPLDHAIWSLRQRVVHRLLTSARFTIEDPSWGIVLSGPEGRNATSDDE